MKPIEVLDRETGACRWAGDALDDAEEAGRYQVVCYEHGFVVNVDTVDVARSLPCSAFCDDCRALAARGERVPPPAAPDLDPETRAEVAKLRALARSMIEKHPRSAEAKRAREVLRKLRGIR